MLFRVVAVLCILIFGCGSSLSARRAGRQSSSGITYTGGSGESFHDAIIISGAKSKSAGISAEYIYITQKYGMRGKGWLLVGQTVIRERNKIVDVIEIQLDGAMNRRIYYFDVSEFLLRRR
ncbi:MAG: hypothetical protein JW913_10780 [Chitinispirillaceae bacterium]|nr:hypothetical protein [Chitinispirillaceae bacterium]